MIIPLIYDYYVISLSFLVGLLVYLFFGGLTTGNCNFNAGPVRLERVRKQLVSYGFHVGLYCEITKFKAGDVWVT